ncbi:MAG: cysteine desulfurase [Pirellulales bacterium]|nr:cysteine desulfurase [Pirellulales bacterium]
MAAEFPVLQHPLPDGGRPVFLDSGASAQKPALVIDKEREVEEQYYANAFRGRYYFGQRIDDAIETTRHAVARLIGARQSDEIVFTAGTTMSLNMVAFGWGRKFLRPGDEVVITEMEHHANFVPWQVVAQQSGATLRILPITDSGELDLAAAESMINEKTAIVAICSMSNVLGTINPVQAICRRAHQYGAVVVVDAAQSIAHGVTDVIADEIDFLTFSGHKMYGPSGVGVLYGRRELLHKMDPIFYGGHMIQSVGREVSTWADPPSRFEAGTMPIVQIIGLAAAIEFMESLGFDAIEKLEQELTALAHHRLAAIEGLKIHGPSLDKKGAIVSFSIDGIATEDLAIRLDQRGVFTRHGHHCAMVLHQRLNVPATTRASFGLYNTPADVEALAAAIEFGIDDIRR